MLNDADPKYFAWIYIVCGYTDLRYGINSLAAIIKRKYKVSLFVPNTLFLFCSRSACKIKGMLWKAMVSCSCTNALNQDTSPDLEILMDFVP